MKPSFLKFYWKNTWGLLPFTVSILTIFVIVNGFNRDAVIWIVLSSVVNVGVFIGRYIEWKKL